MARVWDFSGAEATLNRLATAVGEQKPEAFMTVGFQAGLPIPLTGKLLAFMEVELENCKARNMRRNPLRAIARAIVANEIKEGKVADGEGDGA